MSQNVPDTWAFYFVGILLITRKKAIQSKIARKATIENSRRIFYQKYGMNYSLLWSYIIVINKITLRKNKTALGINKITLGTNKITLEQILSL